MKWRKVKGEKMKFMDMGEKRGAPAPHGIRNGKHETAGGTAKPHILTV